MIDLNDEEQVKAWKAEARRCWFADTTLAWEDIAIDLLRSDWKPEDWRLVKAIEIVKEHGLYNPEIPSHNSIAVQSALAAIRWCEEQGFKKP